MISIAFMGVSLAIALFFELGYRLQSTRRLPAILDGLAD